MEHAVLARLRTERAQGGAMVRSRRAFWIVVVALSVSITGNNAPSPIYPIFQTRFGSSTGAS
jgi:hypothetical protein